MISKRISSLQINAFVASDGLLIYGFQDGTGNSATLTLIFKQFVTLMDKYRPQWRQTYVIQLDNSKVHTSAEFQQNALADMDIPVIYNSPGSFALSPVEKLFAYMKAENFNDDNYDPRVAGKPGRKTNQEHLSKELVAQKCKLRLEQLPVHSQIGFFERAYSRIYGSVHLEKA